MKQRAEHNVVFPNIEQWIWDYPCTVSEFCQMTGVNRDIYYNMMTGKTAPNYETIEKILRFTGMDYEEAFEKRKW